MTMRYGLGQQRGGGQPATWPQNIPDWMRQMQVRPPPANNPLANSPRGLTRATAPGVVQAGLDRQAALAAYAPMTGQQYTPYGSPYPAPPPQRPLQLPQGGFRPWPTLPTSQFPISRFATTGMRPSGYNPQTPAGFPSYGPTGGRGVYPDRGGGMTNVTPAEGVAPGDAWRNYLAGNGGGWGNYPSSWADVALGRFAPMPQLLTPSAQYNAQMGPTAQQQYQGYAQATMGWTPEETMWRQQLLAPPMRSPIIPQYR